MNKNVFCYFLKKYAISLKKPPYPGKLGEKIYKNISELAWKQWMSQQTKIINEKKLNMIDVNDRKTLELHMIDFLFHQKKNV